MGKITPKAVVVRFRIFFHAQDGSLECNFKGENDFHLNTLTGSI